MLQKQILAKKGHVFILIFFLVLCRDALHAVLGAGSVEHRYRHPDRDYLME
jgi:hypothetical protein